MVLLVTKRERTWTLGLCSVYLLQNAILAENSATERSKEPFLLDNTIFQKSYSFEDFFWTGSGDGPLAEDLLNNVTDLNTAVILPSPFETWRTTTVFHTTTILFATVYPNIHGCGDGYDCMPEISPVQTGSIDFSLPTYPPPHPPFNVPDIRPSSTENYFPLDSSLYPSPFPEPANDVDSSSTSPKTTTHQFFDSNVGGRGTYDADEAKTTVFPENPFDQKYWLLTIVRNDNYLPNLELNSTETKLSTLYRQAFNRRQDKYYGPDVGDRRDWQPVKVHIVNVTNVGNDIGLIYSITVGGKPVPAITAANDMRLMTTREVIAELGRPILTKAEPYIKVAVPFGARVRGRARDTWLLVGCVIAAIFLLLILVGLFAFLLSKKQKSRMSSAKTTGRVEEEKGTSNLAFDGDADIKVESVRKHGRKTRFKTKDVKTTDEGGDGGGNVCVEQGDRRGSVTSTTCSESSEADLVRLRHQKARKEVDERPRPKPRTRERRIQSSDCKNAHNRRAYALSAGSIMSKNTYDGSIIEEYSPRATKSPTSYLSMPSVKAFPRGTKITEPLNKILEPTSIRHLDADSDSPQEGGHVQTHHVEVDVEHVCETKNKYVRGSRMTRHASLEGEDPGIIGPVVWNRHCQKIIERDSGILNEEEYENVNVGRMRKRFNELLDDALSMFGSKNPSPEGSDIGGGAAATAAPMTIPVKQPDNRVHSAVLRPSVELVVDTRAGHCRPNTTGSKRPQSSVVTGPKGAWETPSCSTLGRPMSADVILETSPTIDRDLIYANSELGPNDPAIPLIAAIKSELKKFNGPPD